MGETISQNGLKRDRISKEEIEEVLRDLDPDGSKVFKYEDYVKSNWDFWNKDQGSGKNF